VRPVVFTDAENGFAFVRAGLSTDAANCSQHQLSSSTFRVIKSTTAVASAPRRRTRLTCPEEVAERPANRGVHDGPRFTGGWPDPVRQSHRTAERRNRTLSFDRRLRRSTACMCGVTQILASIERGDPHAAEHLLPLVYAELRKLAAARMAEESSDHTLQPTALVHEAYLRLVDVTQVQPWNSRGHFFAAAAEAMRRILIESARRKDRRQRLAQTRANGAAVEPAAYDEFDNILAVDEALTRLAMNHPDKAELVKLRYFAGLTLPDAADVMGISIATAERQWRYARAWLSHELRYADADSS